jgi:hypothetical protein
MEFVGVTSLKAALEARRRSLGEKHVATKRSYAAVAGALEKLGRYAL